MQDVARLPFVRVHIGRGQDTCISEQARRTRRTPTAGGVDGVKTVRRARARRTRRTPTASGIDGVKMVGRARGVKTVGRAGGNGTSSLLGLSSFAGAAHAKDANGQWSRRCEDGVAQAHDADGQWNRRCEDGGTRKRCEDGGVRRIIGSKQGRTIWGSMDTVAWSMMDTAAVGSSAGP